MYTPQFSDKATVTVLRLGWALGLSVPKTIDRIISEIQAVSSPSMVCSLCKDSTKYKLCRFNQNSIKNEDEENAV
jgi:recombinational DNA repair protein RecR